jgi:MATE family multidrug resistance protein
MQLMGFFSPREAGAIDFDSIMQYGRVILACAACYNFFDATFLIFSGALRGAGDTKYPMWLIISFAWGVLVPGMLILVLIFKAGVIAIWVFITIYVFALSVMIFLRFRSGKWKNIEMINDNQ